MISFTPLNPDQIEALGKTLDPFGIAHCCHEVQRAWLEHPHDLAEALSKLGAGLWALQMQGWQRFAGVPADDLVPAVGYDERFQDPIWTENAYLNTVKQHYLLTTHWLEDAIYNTPGATDQMRRRAAFWIRQALNAVAPTNYFWTNPGAILRFFQSGGKSLVEGMQHFLADAQRGVISLVDEHAFTVGKDLAITPGAVVFRNELLELIQYAPATEQVHEMPILIVAPWINKYYILDLNPEKSLVRYLTEQGFTVFVTSWKNPGPELRQTQFEDYMVKGVLEAVHAALDICAVPQLHLTGYCIGGTIVAALMAWLNHPDAAPEQRPVAHWTLFTTLLDFANPGEIDVFIDEETIEYLERQMAKRGYMDGNDLATSFRMLRSNSLIWHYYVHNYLYGESPPAFDVLFWNMDSTRLPEAMHSFYLRQLYLQNRLAQPGGLELAGRSIDLGRITQPLYAVGTEQDHIVPWKESFKVAGLVNGPVRYVLATSGHILGIVSPPVDPPKRRYWVGEASGQCDPEVWCGSTNKVPGSWWDDWTGWLRPQCGPLQPPPGLGDTRHPQLAAAPGTYVLER